MKYTIILVMMTSLFFCKAASAAPLGYTLSKYIEKSQSPSAKWASKKAKTRSSLHSRGALAYGKKDHAKPSENTTSTSHEVK